MIRDKKLVLEHLKRIKEIKSKRERLSGSLGGLNKRTRSNLVKIFNAGIVESKDMDGNNILISSLMRNELPFNLMYDNFGSDRYYDITHSETSKYSDIYNADKHVLEKLINKFPEYINKQIIDIGCGDGIKIFNMMKKGFKNNKIKGTINYLGLDDSKGMLNLAKEKFYREYYSKKKNDHAYIKSDNIDLDMKKVRPWFRKGRIQEINGLNKMGPKTIFFLGGTIGNLSNIDIKGFFRDMKKILKKDDKLIVGYFPLLKLPNEDSKEHIELIDDYIEREKELYERFDMHYTGTEEIIKDLKKVMPGVIINYEDISYSLDYDKRESILYDVRVFNRDIIYQNIIVIPQGQIFKSKGTKIDEVFFEKNKKDFNKDYVESLYSTKENDMMINEFLQGFDVRSSDYRIEKKYNIQTNIFEMYLIPITEEGITFKIKTGGDKLEITKYPEDRLLLHKSKRFDDNEIISIIEGEGLKVVDSLGEKTNLYPDIDLLKLLIISG